MNRNDLRRVDLNLLIVFETLMHERSVTRAAEKLFLGQPAISAALSRLRNLFDDPLFVRTGRSMEPSARAHDDLRPAVPGAGLDFHRGQPRRRIRPGHQQCGVPHRPVGRRRIRPAAAAAQAHSRRSAGYRAGGAPGQLPADADAAGLGRDLGGCQLHQRAASQRQAQGAAPQHAETAARRQRARRHHPGRLLRAAACAGVVCRGPVGVHRRGAGRDWPQAPCGAGGAAVQRAGELAGGHRHCRYGAGLHGGCVDRGGWVAGRGSAVGRAQFRAAHGLARGRRDNDPAERWLRSRIQMFFGDP
ncbi:LysR family transcriptional regulator [Pseudomonas putida S11]|nr:LysR family transcriptional regulator [Pseudomonas putida S11]